MVNPLNLFGCFVHALKDHIQPAFPDENIQYSDIERAIVGDVNKSRASKLMHIYAAKSHAAQPSGILLASEMHAPTPHREDSFVDLSWYHDQTIGKILMEAYAGTVDDDYLHDVVKRGHFEGRHGDLTNIYAVKRAVLQMALRGSRNMNLPTWLDAAPLAPRCKACMTMYRLYDEMFYQNPGVRHYARGSERKVSDLAVYVEDIEEDDLRRVSSLMEKTGWERPGRGLTRSMEIYARLLTAILMGPVALKAQAGEGETPSNGSGSLYVEELTGFSLAQKTVGEGGVLGTDADLEFVGRPAFTLGRRPADGEEVDPCVGYVTCHSDPSQPDTVSRLHAEIDPLEENGVSHGWVLFNRSETNGTAVLRGDEVLSLAHPSQDGDWLILEDGDEIWLAPDTAVDGSLQPAYGTGAVLVFHNVYSYVY